MSSSCEIYLVERPPVAENKVDGSLNVAVLEVVAAPVVVECVLGSVELAVVEGALVTGDAESHGLPPNGSAGWSGRGVLLIEYSTSRSNRYPKCNFFSSKELSMSTSLQLWTSTKATETAR